MASAYDKYYASQPPAVKVIVVAGLGLLGYSLYRSIKQKADEAKANLAAQAAGSELATLQNQGIQPSYADSQYLVFVNTLVQAMTGCGTNEEQVYQVFQQMHNEADVRKLIVSFGVQHYTPCAVTDPISYLRWQFDDKAFGGDLGTWLGYDLSGGELSKVNSILKTNGINYQF